METIQCPKEPKFAKQSKFQTTWGIILLHGVLAILNNGCASLNYRNTMRSIKPAYESGDFNRARSATATKIAGYSGSPSNSALLWHLNHGAVLRAAGEHEAAQEVWEEAQPLFEQGWENERVNLVRDTLGLAIPGVGDTTYYARAHEGIMLYTYRMLDAMQSGNMDEARRFILSAMAFRDEVITESEKRVAAQLEAIERGREKGIENDQDALLHSALSAELKEKENTENLSKVEEDSFVASDTVMQKIREQQATEEAFQQEELALYSNYANPLTGFLTYLFLKTHGTGLRQTDRNNMERELHELTVFAAGNSVIENELQQEPNQPLAETVFVIFETGTAPYKEEVRLDIPIPTKYISHVGIAYPRLVFSQQHIPVLEVSDSTGNKVKTELLTNMDAIVKRTFDDSFSAVIARQIAQAVANAAVNAALNYAASQLVKEINDPGAKMLAQVGVWATTAALSSAMTSADIRSWELLPKQFQIARLALPADRKLQLFLPANNWQEEIVLDNGSVIVVLIKSTGILQHQPLVSQFKLK